MLGPLNFKLISYLVFNAVFSIHCFPLCTDRTMEYGIWAMPRCELRGAELSSTEDRYRGGAELIQSQSKLDRQCDLILLTEILKLFL